MLKLLFNAINGLFVATPTAISFEEGGDSIIKERGLRSIHKAITRWYD